MPTLAELRSRWFLNFTAGGGGFPPVRRYPGCTVTPFTDGNLVEPLIDGERYMGRWYALINALQSADCEVYHSACWLEPVPVLGQFTPASDALAVMISAHQRGVAIHILMSGGLTSLEYNIPSNDRLRRNGITTTRFDDRFPSLGTNHSKYIVLKDPATPEKATALVASCDLAIQRWDTTMHLPPDSNRGHAPTHEIGMQVRGPAALDIERSFRDRWNDDSPVKPLPVEVDPQKAGYRIPNLPIPPRPKINTPESAPPPAGSHSVQVLHTYGIAPWAYSWSTTGEFSCWASYLNAIKKATRYIYIEEQYLLPFGSPPPFEHDGVVRDTDIVYQLGEAIRRGVRVFVLLPGKDEDPDPTYQIYQRKRGVHYLAHIAAAPPGEFIVGYLKNVIGTHKFEVYVHGKLMIVDDEFVLAGSANICRRSMTHDGEIHLGIVDANNQFARDLRMTLWEEHLQTLIPNDLNQALDLFRTYVETAVETSPWRVRPYSTDDPGSVPFGQDTQINKIRDPYAGPPIS